MALLLLRLIGERIFEVKPEPIPALSVPHNSPLSISVHQHRESQGLSEQSSIFYPLGDAHTALLTRFDLAEKSAQSLDVQYYLFHDDESGRALLGNLIDAASRGIKVRLLLDDMDTQGRDHLFARLALDTDNFELRVFNSTWLRSQRFVESISRFPRVTRRMHNKSFTVDSSIMVVRGRNSGNEYVDVNTAVAFTDFDILAAGPVALDAAREINEYWYCDVTPTAAT